VTPDHPEVPIVPGPNYEPPTAPLPPPVPAAPLAPPAPAQPAYYQPPSQAPAWSPGRAAGNTVVVILVLVGVFCFLPAVVCGAVVILGNLGR
jgi:hypothetical protein